MINKITNAFKRYTLVTAEKVIAKSYVRQCEKLAEGDDMKLADYLRPSVEPICLFTKVDKVDDNGHVVLGEFVCVRNEYDEEWILTFDDYVHAKEMAEMYTEMTNTSCSIYKTSAMCIFTQEAPIMGASCCKTDGMVIETPKRVYRTLYKAHVIRERLRKARVAELKKRKLEEEENGS